MKGYYVVMARPVLYGPHLLSDDTFEEYSGKRWNLDQELDAHEELWDAQHDGEVQDAYIKEVIL